MLWKEWFFEMVLAMGVSIENNIKEGLKRQEMVLSAAGTSFPILCMRN